MQPSQEDLAALFYAIHARERELWEVKLAASTDNFASSYHPNSIRQEIHRLQSLLKEVSAS